MRAVDRPMEPQSIAASSRSRVVEIAGEMDALFQRQIELMKSETFVGLTPVEREEYEKITARIAALFRECGRLKRTQESR
jgi:hypothetical protein